jgi:hypothetical protein
MNLERCREKLEREAKHATAGIFGGKSWIAEFFLWRLGGRWREAVQIMVDERRDAQIDNRRNL